MDVPAATVAESWPELACPLLLQLKVYMGTSCKRRNHAVKSAYAVGDGEDTK